MTIASNAAGTTTTRPTPLGAWIIAAYVAYAAALAITAPKSGIVLVAAPLLIWGGASILAHPLHGFRFALCLFPFYTVLRGLAMVLHLPVPLSLVGMWPEVVLCLMTASIVIAHVKEQRRLRLTWNDLPVIALLMSTLYALLLTILQRDITGTVYGLHLSIMPFLFYFVARWLSASAREVSGLIWLWLASFVAMAVLSLAEYIVRPGFMIPLFVAVRPDFYGAWTPADFYRWYPRMQSLFYAEQLWGMVCGFVSVLCLARRAALAWAGERHSAGQTLLFILSTLCLVLSMSRGALIAWATAVILLMLFRGAHRRTIIAFGLMGACLLGAFVVTLKQDERVQTLVARTVALTDGKNRLAYDRVEQWEIALSQFPLFPAGRGLGRVGAAAMFHPTGDSSDLIVDGGIFKILAEQGLPGILLFLVGVTSVGFVLLRFLWLRHARGLYQALCLALFCLLGGFLVQNVGGNVFDTYYVMPLFWMLLGFTVSGCEAERA